MNEPNRRRDDLWKTNGIEFWRELIPNLEERARPFRVDEAATDDEVRQIFCQHFESQMPAARVACEAHDPGPLRELGHSLQGAGGTVGLAAMSVVGLELSAAARSGDWPRCAAIIDRLEQWFEIARQI